MTDLFRSHDLFFKTIFSHLDIVEDALVSNLPQLADLIVPNTLEKVATEFVNSDLKPFYSDLILKAKLKAKPTSRTQMAKKIKTRHKNKHDRDSEPESEIIVYFFLLLEHKSTPEERVAYALLNIIMEIWRAEDEKKPLPFIYPIVIYHGKRPWNVPRDLASLVQIPEGWEEFVPNFKYDLLDLAALRDSQIKGNAFSKAGLLTLKHIYDQNFEKRFPRIFELLRNIEINEKTLNLITGLLKCVAGATDKLSRKDIRNEIQRVLPGKGEKIMPTLADQWIKEGEQLGLEKGRQEGEEFGLLKGKREGLLKGLELALEFKFGEKGLKLYRRMAKQADLETLTAIQTALRYRAPISDLEKMLKKD